MGNTVSYDPARIAQLRASLNPRWVEVQPLFHDICVTAVRQYFTEGPPNVRRVLLSTQFSSFESRCLVLIECIAGAKGDINAERETMEQLAVALAHRGFTSSDVLYILKGLLKCMQQKFPVVGPEWATLSEEFASPILSHIVQITTDLLQAISRGKHLDHPDLLRWIRTYSPPNAMQPRFMELCARRAAEPHCLMSGEHRILPIKRRYFSLRQRYLYVFDIEPEGLVNEDGPAVIIDLARIRRIEKGNDEEDNDVLGTSSNRTFNASVSAGGTDKLGSASQSTAATPTGAGGIPGSNSSAKYYSVSLQFGDSDLCHYFYFTSEISRNAWWRHLSNTSGVLSPYCSAAPPEIHQISVTSYVQDRFPYKASVPDFEFIKMLGAGTFGRVVQVRHRASGSIFAMKIIRKLRFHSIRNVVEVRRERSVLENLSNPYILRINATFQSESRIYFLLDYLPGGELLRHTQKAPGHHFNEEAAKFYIAELAVALEYLRVRGIVHRDIKGDNLVLDEDGHLVLTDFGFAKRLNSGTKKDKTCCGTLAYIAPEMLQIHRTGYGVEVDWWSMGVVLFTVLTGYFPFLKTTRKDTVNAIINQPLQFPSKPVLTPEARDACHKLMAKKPENRIANIADLKAHPWFAGFNWTACEKRQLRPPFLPATAGGNDKKDSKKTDAEYEDERQTAQTFVEQSILPEKDVFGPFFASQEAAGSDRDESDSESDGDEDEAAAYERLGNDVGETRATFNQSSQMLRPFFSSISLREH